MNKKFTIIIPIYNENESIFKLIKEINIELKNQNPEIIIIDDGSTDDFFKNFSNLTFSKNISVQKHEIDLNKSIKSLTYEKVIINLHPEVSCEIILNVARSSEEATKQKQIGKAVTNNSENEDNEDDIPKLPGFKRKNSRRKTKIRTVKHLNKMRLKHKFSSS